MTAIAMTAAIAYAVWVRPRARTRLLRVDAAPDRRASSASSPRRTTSLFYVFWEAMLIPLYVLVGVWGGPGPAARDADVLHLHDGGLAADAGLDHRARHLARVVRHDRAERVQQLDWIFLGFVAAFVVKAPIFPFHGWLPDAYREAPAEVAGVLSGVVSKAAAYGFLYVAILHFPQPTNDFRTPILVLAGDRPDLRLAARLPRARHPRRRRLLEPRPARA